MPHPTPRLEVICGSMFSGKSEELIRRVRRAQFARQKIQVFKPAADLRAAPLLSLNLLTPVAEPLAPASSGSLASTLLVASHNGISQDALPINQAQDLLALVAPSTNLVAIDEVQFFDPAIVEVCQLLVQAGHRVIVAGLDLDFRGDPFGPMPGLLIHAEQVTKLQAICMVCAEPASRSQRLINGQPARYSEPIFQLGAAETYEARCRLCHQVPGHPSSHLEKPKP
jgi:thymidine kinase